MLITSKVAIEDTPLSAPDEAGTDPLEVSVTGNFDRFFSHGAPTPTASAAYIT